MLKIAISVCKRIERENLILKNVNVENGKMIRQEESNNQVNAVEWLKVDQCRSDAVSKRGICAKTSGSRESEKLKNLHSLTLDNGLMA